MRCKMINLMVRLILVLSLSVSSTLKIAAADDGFRQCEHTVKNWATSSFASELKDDIHSLRDLLFFLHIPRTGGRTYFHCFLRKLYTSSQECPRSYDKLRFNPRKSNCRLLSTHDDYSMVSKLPKEKTSVVTILRNPVDRVFSTYEFSVEVAARFLIHPNLTSVARTTKVAQRVRRKATGTSTLDIWPWKYLVPWMREDLFARRDARKLRGQTYLIPKNSYDMEDFLMPLHEYINKPIARDVVHNGATFQIAGLTNNSYSAEAHEVRHCVLKYHNLGEYVLRVAKKRLEEMLYVGITENHRESAVMFGNIVGAQVISQHIISSSRADIVGNNSEQGALPNTNSDDVNKRNNVHQTLKNATLTENDEASHKNMTVGKLMEAYESCVSSLRDSQGQRRINSLKHISPANFTKEARRHVSKELIQEIMSLNSLDVELYNYAQHIFRKQEAHMMQSMLETGKVGSSSSSRRWELLLLFTIVFSLVFLVYFVNGRRRSSKVKL